MKQIFTKRTVFSNSWFKRTFMLSLLLSLFAFGAYAQPQYSNISLGTFNNGNYFPFGVAGSGNGSQVQQVTLAGELVGATEGLIEKVYYQRNSANTGGNSFTDLRIEIGQTTATTFSTSNYQTGGFVAKNGSHTIPAGTAGQWFDVPLTTPVVYDPTKSIWINITHTGTSGPIFYVNFYNNCGSTNTRRIYGSNGASTGNSDCSWYAFGVDLLPLSSGTNNAALLDVTPELPCGGSNDIYATIANRGKNPIDSVLVEWSLGGVAQTPFNYQGPTIDTFDQANINASRTTVKIGTASFAINNPKELKVWTSMPNGVQDTANDNDTIAEVKSAALSGTITVGGVTADYQTIQSAINDLQTYGVCGAVVLDIDAAEGPYNEQLTIKEIPGTSSTNTVTIKGNGARVWYGATTLSNKHVLRFDGCQYVTVDNLELEVTSTSYAWTLHFLNSSNNTVKNCKIYQTTSSSTNTNFIGVCFNSNPDYYYYSFGGQNNVLENNDIRGGYYNILMYGTYGGSGNNNQILNNTIRDFYYYGMYVYGQKNCIIRGNDIHRLNRTSITTFYGIYLYNGNTGLICERNSIHDPRPKTSSSNFTAYGIASYYEYYTNHNNIIRNNLIYDFENNSNNYGIYCYNSYPYTALNNTVVFDNESVSSGTHYGINTREAYGTQDNIHNNNIVIKKGTGGTKYGLYDGGNNAGTGLNLDYNNVSVTGSGAGTAYWGAVGGSGVETLEDWNDATASNFNNTEVYPEFRDAANGDYEPKDARLNGAGMNTSDVTNDFNGVSRGSSKNDIGAFNMDCDFGITAFTLPNATECELYTPEIEVTIKNFSAKEYLNIPVGLLIDGSSLVTNAADITLSPSASNTYTYENSYTFYNAGSYTIDVFPLNDAILPNDTQSFDITILPAPRGSELSQGTGFEGLYRGGALNSYDVTTAGDEVVYNISTPTGGGTFNDGNYGSAWTIPMYVETLSGVALPSSMYSVTAPTSSTDAVMKFTPSSAYTDSILRMVIPVKNLGNGCDSSIVRHIFVAPIPFVNFDAPSVCDGDGIGFTNLSEISTGTLEYEWDFGLTPTVTSTNTSPVFKYPTFGIYDVKLTATSNWGYKHDTIIQVEVYESPNVQFRPVNACEGDAVQFQNNTTVSSGTLNYVWEFGDGSPEDMTTSPSHTYANAGEYTVTLTAEVSGCKRSLKKSAFQFPQPVAEFDISGGDCNEEEVEFTNNSTLEFGRLGNLWDFGDLSYTTEKDAKHSFLTAGEQSITLKVTSEFGCTDQITKKVTLKESPIASFDNTQTCDIDPVEFTNTSFEPTGANVDYTWTFGDPTSTDNTSNLTNPEHKYSLPGARQVTLLAEADNGCAHEVTKDIVIGVQPQADFSAEAGCTDEPIKFNNETTISRGDIEVVYDWSFGSNDVSPENVFTTAGTQSVTLTATAVEGGCKDEITKQIEVGETPSCEFTTATTGHNDVTFTPEASDAGLTYTWLFGDGGSSIEMNPTYTYTFNKAYDVTLQVTSPEGCECSKTVLMRKTSVSDIDFAERVSIYPNPSTGVFTIAIDGNLTEDVSIEVYNSLGAVVAVVDVNQSIDGKYTVDLGNVAAGVYTVKFSSNSSVYTQKVTVTK